MVELKLRMRTLPDHTVILDLGMGFRIVFGVLATVLATGILENGSVGAVPAIALALLAIGALYQEQWTFDAERREIVSRHGLLLLARSRRWAFDAIEQVEYTHYRAGTMPGSKQPTPPGSLETSDPTRASREAMASIGGGRSGRMSQALQRHFLRYSLVTSDGERIRIEMRRVRDWNADIKLPRVVAQTLQVALVESPL